MNTEMDAIKPLKTLYDASSGVELPLPPELATFYGGLRFSLQHGKQYVIANLVTSLDGVVTLGIPGKAGGKEISGSNEQDRALMGLLRAVADAVVVGAGTLREGKGHPLTGAMIYPPLANAYNALRTQLNKTGEPVAVIVTASGRLDPSLPIFQDEGEVLVVTSRKGASYLSQLRLPTSVQVVGVAGEQAESDNAEGSIPASAVLGAVQRVRQCDVVLVEGGPHLLGDFFAEGLINEQFLTLSPQVVGRDSSGDRLGLVEGRTFAPDHPLWGRLSVVKQGNSHLFLRYIFQGAADKVRVPG
jgi:riboflavin biosynthesis pyrimidine reductase